MRISNFIFFCFPLISYALVFYCSEDPFNSCSAIRVACTRDIRAGHLLLTCNRTGWKVSMGSEHPLHNWNIWIHGSDLKLARNLQQAAKTHRGGDWINGCEALAGAFLPCTHGQYDVDCGLGLEWCVLLNIGVCFHMPTNAINCVWNIPPVKFNHNISTETTLYLAQD